MWQLGGAGCVGGQTLMGIPVVHWLRHHPELRGRSLVWPFETGWKAIAPADLEDVEALAAEVRLGLVPAQPLPGEAKELAPVRALAERVAKLDEAGKLGAAFAAPEGVSEAEVQAVEHEEGWILNV